MKDFHNIYSHLIKDTSVWFLHSHPDDESYLTAGIIQQLASMGYETHVVYLSAQICKDQAVSFLRQKEAKCACNILNVNNVHFLNYCESSCLKKDHIRISEANPQVVMDEILTLSNSEDRKNNNKIFFSYDKNGGYGHIDHISLHRIGRLISKYGYPVFEATINQNKFFNWIQTAKELGLDKRLLPLESYWIRDPWLIEEQISYFYKLTSKQLWHKKEALLKHISQIHDDQFPVGLSLDDFQCVFGVEYFVEVLP